MCVMNVISGKTVGFVTSAAYGHTLERGVVFGMVKGIHDIDVKQGFEIEINGTL